MKNISIAYLSGPDVAALNLTNDEILNAVENGLIAAGRGETVIEPRLHLKPDDDFNGHFNVLRGYVAPLNYAGFKIVGDYVDNYKRGLPSEMALLNLFDPRTGMPIAVLDASGITDMRTGAVTALGAKYLAPDKPKVLGHIGARGTAYWNVQLLDHLFDFEEIRVHSRRPESREAFGAKLSQDLGKPVTVTQDWQSWFVTWAYGGEDAAEAAQKYGYPQCLAEVKQRNDTEYDRDGHQIGQKRHHPETGRFGSGVTDS